MKTTRSRLSGARRAYVADKPSRALAILSRVPAGSPDGGKAFVLAARILYEQGRYGVLRKHLNDLGEMVAGRRGPVLHGAFCFYLAKCHQYEMHYLSARDWLKRAAEAFAESNCMQELADTLLAEADVCRQIRGIYIDEAAAILDRAQEIVRHLPPGRARGLMEAKYHGFKGRHYLTLGRYGAALAHFENDYRLSGKYGDVESTLLMEVHIARCLRETGRVRDAAKRLARVSVAALRQRPKLALYHRVEACALDAAMGRRSQARKRARRLAARLADTRQTDLHLFEQAVGLLMDLSMPAVARQLNDQAIRYVENARRRLRTPGDMREFRERWSRFYQHQISLLLDKEDEGALYYHVMNQSRTLADLLPAAPPPGGAAPRATRSLPVESVESALVGPKGGTALNRQSVRQMLNRFVNNHPHAALCFTTWYQGKIAFLLARRVGRHPGATVSVCCPRCPDPRRAAGTVRAQECFGMWLRELRAAERVGTVVVIPDDFTRHVPFHTAPLDDGPAFASVPVVYHLSLPLLNNCAARTPALSRSSLTALVHTPNPRLRTGPETKELLAAAAHAGVPRRLALRLTHENLRRAARCTVVHMAGHHIVSLPSEGYAAIATASGHPIGVADILGGPRWQSRFVCAALCESAGLVSCVYNEPWGLLSALMIKGVAGIVAARAPISGEESQAWTRCFYRCLFEEGLYPDFIGAYIETSRLMYRTWNSKERAGKIVYYGV